MVALLSSCANPGNGPDGGPYDETPPRIVKVNPALGATNQKTRKVTLLFNEMIKVEKAQEKVIVSPPQIEVPEIKTSGRTISVELMDTLQANTTYTIDFSDAIVDANESNPLGRFTYFFSTGNQVDTMEVAGYVLSADNLEPVKGILVGLHPASEPDSAFTTKAFARVARTDGNGRFCIKGVAQGNYRAYALRDMDGNFRRSRGEMLAFMHDSFSVSSFIDTRYDTLWTDTIHYDTIRSVRYTHYLPDELTLLAFDEKSTVRQLLKSERQQPEWFRMYFTAPSSHNPVIEGVNFDAEGAFEIERTTGRDTITYWLRDTTMLSLDTLQMHYTYEAVNDSTGVAFLRTDTLELIPRHTYARRMKERAEQLEKWEKKREKRHKRGDFSKETPPGQAPLAIKAIGSRSIVPTQNFIFESEEPLLNFDTAGVHLYHVVDSVRTPMPFRLERDSLRIRLYTLRAEWRPGQKYVVEIDTASMEGLSRRVNDPETYSVIVKRTEEMGAIFFVLEEVNSTAIVQLLATSGDKVVRQVTVRDGRADFFYLDPGTYYARLFFDDNLNGRWDPGEYASLRMPEQVYYFPGKFEVRANWDIEQVWRPTDIPLFRQKPAALVKQRESEKRMSAKGRNAERERERR